LIRANKKQTPPLHILATNKQNYWLGWLCEQRLVGAAVSSWCVSPPNYLDPGCSCRGLFSTGAESEYQRTRTDLLMVFLPIGFSFKSNAANKAALRVDLKEKSWPNEMENGARGRLNTFAH